MKNRYTKTLVAVVILLIATSCSTQREDRQRIETTEGFAEEIVNHSPRFVMINDTLASFSKRRSVVFKLNEKNRRFYVVK